MGFDNIMMAVIIGFCAIIFGLISLWAYRRQDPMHFWAGTTVDPDTIIDVPAYNRAHGKIWLVFTLLHVFAAIISLFDMMAGGVAVVAASVLGIPYFFIAYNRIQKKYKR